MKPLVHEINDRGIPVWARFDAVLAEGYGSNTIWSSGRPHEYSRCIARMTTTQQWWVCRFNVDGHAPEVGPFDDWQPAFATFKLLT